MIVSKAALTPSTTIAHPRNGNFGIAQQRPGIAGLSELRLKL